MVTDYIKDLQDSGNLDTDITNDDLLEQFEQMKKVIVLNGDGINDEKIRDDVEIVYFRSITNAEIEDYEEGSNKGYKITTEFGNEFSGNIKAVGLVNADFINPFTSNSFSNTPGNSIVGSGQPYAFTASDMINGYTKIIDVDFVNGKLITLNIKYNDNNDQWSASFCRWNHNFRNFRIGGAQSYLYLDAVISVDINHLFDTPDGQGGYETAGPEVEKMVFAGIDETSDKYVITCMMKSGKIFNNLVIDRRNYTQTQLYRWILPEYVDFPSNYDQYFSESDDTIKLFYSAFYRGKFCALLNVTESGQTTAKMCYLDYRNGNNFSTASETHFLDGSGNETTFDQNFDAVIVLGQPLIGYGSGSFISSSLGIKNDIAYLKESGYDDWGFYYKGLMFTTNIYPSNEIIMMWKTCPYCLTVVEQLPSAIFKAQNENIKYTFRIVNTGGNFYNGQ